MTKKAQAYSLDLDLKNFIDGKQWEFKMNRSQIVNTIFRYLKDHPEELEKIIPAKKKK